MLPVPQSPHTEERWGDGRHGEAEAWLGRWVPGQAQAVGCPSQAACQGSACLRMQVFMTPQTISEPVLSSQRNARQNK